MHLYKQFKHLKGAKGWHWYNGEWTWFGDQGDVRESLTRVSTDGVFSSPKLGRSMAIEVLTEENGWAIIWLHDKYFIKHLACGTILRHNAKNGCFCHQKIQRDCKCEWKNKNCKKPECMIIPPTVPVDPCIYGKWRIMTFRQPDLKGLV